MDDHSYLEGIIPHSVIQKGNPPPIEFPLSEGEIEDFPRYVGPAYRAFLRESFRERRWFYRGQLIQIAANARRPGHGQYVIILVPKTFEKLLTQIEWGPGYKKAGVAEALRQLYYLGKIMDEIETDVSSKTLTRYLQAAESVLDILREHRNRPLTISLKAITLSFKVLRYGRDAWLDVRRYFFYRIF